MSKKEETKEESAELETSAPSTDSSDVADDYNTSGETFNDLIKKSTKACLDDLIDRYNHGLCQFVDSSKPDYPNVEAELLACTNRAIDSWNLDQDKADRQKHLKALKPVQIASCLVRLDYGILVIGGDADLNCDDADMDDDASNTPRSGESADNAVVAFYIADPRHPDYGTYVTGEDCLRQRMRKYNYGITEKEQNETLRAFRDIAPRKPVTTDKDLVPVNNGVFHYRRKELLQFDPGVIFLAKSHVNYVDNPQNVVIHNDVDGTDWDVESWVCDLTDDEGIRALIWQWLGANVRPYVPWNKSIWFYSDKGANGKGTLCQLARNLLGYGTSVSLPLSKFENNFALEGIISKNAIITDENPVGKYTEAAANFKAIVTGDVVNIDRKHKPAISYRFRGLVTMCFNDNPRVGDMSDSFYRRVIVVPMSKTFVANDRDYIKEDYVGRQEVLEYVLHKVLFETNFYKFDEPETSKTALSEMKLMNDPVRQFFDELEREALWDLLPWDFIQALFYAWYKKNCPSGFAPNWTTAKKRICDLVVESKVFTETGSDDGVPAQPSSSGRMNCPELLIAKYNVEEWANPYSGGDPIKMSKLDNLKKNYRGLIRLQELHVTEADFGDADLDSIQIKNNARKRQGLPVEGEE